MATRGRASSAAPESDLRMTDDEGSDDELPVRRIRRKPSPPRGPAPRDARRGRAGSGALRGVEAEADAATATTEAAAQPDEADLPEVASSLPTRSPAGRGRRGAAGLLSASPVRPARGSPSKLAAVPTALAAPAAPATPKSWLDAAVETLKQPLVRPAAVAAAVPGAVGPAGAAAAPLPAPLALPQLQALFRMLLGLLEGTVDGGCSNSALLLGPRGSGKTLVLERALATARARYGDQRLAVVRLCGLRHAEDKAALRELARQLCKDRSLPFDRKASYEDNLAFMHAALEACARAHIAVVIVLDSFDLFAARPKQSLLYALLDAMGSAGAQAAVLGVSSRHDAAELLEKRVRSRFSHRRLLFAPGGAGAGPGGAGGAADAPAVPAPAPTALVRELLRLPPATADAAAAALAEGSGAEAEPPASPAGGARGRAGKRAAAAAGCEANEARPAKRSAPTAAVALSADAAARAAFDASVDAALAAPAVASAVAGLRALDGGLRAAGDLAFASLCAMRQRLAAAGAAPGAAAGTTAPGAPAAPGGASVPGGLAAGDVLAAVSLLRADPRSLALRATTQLELILLCALRRLEVHRRKPSSPFEAVWEEYQLFQSGAAGGRVQAPRPLALAAFQRLLGAELAGFADRRGRVGGGGSGGLGGGGSGGFGGAGCADCLWELRPVQLLVTGREIEAAVAEHRAAPAALSAWLKHENVGGTATRTVAPAAAAGPARGAVAAC